MIKEGNKFYEADENGNKKESAQPLTEADTENLVISSVAPDGKTNKPVTIANVKSGLGLDGSKDNNNGGAQAEGAGEQPAEGTPGNPQAISVEAARKAIAGDNKDGKGGLLTKKGAGLNHAATVQDLQAIAQAGITFAGNNEDTEVHRPLGTKLMIIGEGVEKDNADSFQSAAGNIVVVGDKDNGKLTVKLSKNLTNIESIGGGNGTNGGQAKGKITFKDGDVDFNENTISNVKSAVAAPTEQDKTYLDSLQDANEKAVVNAGDLKNISNALKDSLTNSGLSFEGDSGTKVSRKLGETLTIKGGETEENKLSENNIGVVADGNNTLTVKLAKELKEMTSFETAEKDGVKTKVDAEGLLVTGTANGNDGKTAKYGLDGATITGKDGSATYGATSTTLKDKDNHDIVKLDAANNTIQVNGKDGVEGVKINGQEKAITGLAERDFNDNDYGSDNNKGRAATEGAVKNLADAVGVGKKGVLPADSKAGASGQDGLNGLTLLDKIQALRDGTAGSTVFTDRVGNRLIKIDDENGKPQYYKEGDLEKGEDGGYKAKTGANPIKPEEIRLSAVNPDGSTSNPTVMANVASGIGGSVTDDKNDFITKLNSVGENPEPGEQRVGKDIVVTAQDLKNLADTGFKIQTNKDKPQTVKAGQTVQVVDGANTKVSAITGKDGVFTYSINVNGLAMNYVNKDGKPLAKVGDKFYLLKENGEIDLDNLKTEDTRPAGVALADPEGNQAAQTLGGVKAGKLATGSTEAVNGEQLANILGTDQDGNAITSNIGGTGKDNLNDAIKEVRGSSVSDVVAGHNIEVTTKATEKGKEITLSTSMTPSFNTVGVGATRDELTGEVSAAPVSLGVSQDGALALTGADNQSPVRITNVADGVHSSDAVNKGQLDRVADALATADSKLRAGTAGAVAVAGLPQAYLPGKSMVAVSGGSFSGQNAVAVGLSSISDNGKVVVKLTGSYNSQNQVTGSLGVGYQW